MLKKARVWTDVDSFRVMLKHPKFGKTVGIAVELRIASLYLEEPEYIIDNAIYSETEMLELVEALLGARKNWEDYQNGDHKGR